MELSNDQRGDYIRVEVAPKEQGAAYTPGNGDVLFLNDRTQESDFYHSLTTTQRVVLAARFRSWADMAEAVSDYSDVGDRA